MHTTGLCSEKTELYYLTSAICILSQLNYQNSNHLNLSILDPSVLFLSHPAAPKLITLHTSQPFNLLKLPVPPDVFHLCNKSKSICTGYHCECQLHLYAYQRKDVGHYTFFPYSSASTAAIRSIKNHQAFEMAFTLFPSLAEKRKNLIKVLLLWVHLLMDGKRWVQDTGQNFQPL